MGSSRPLSLGPYPWVPNPQIRPPADDGRVESADTLDIEGDCVGSEQPQILVSAGVLEPVPLQIPRDNCKLVFIPGRLSPRLHSQPFFVCIFSPLPILSSPVTSTLISVLMTITSPDLCSEFRTLISSCTQIFQRLLINRSHSHTVTMNFICQPG